MSKDSTALRVLIAPLNWGLGHATRSLPIVDDLRRAAEASGRAVVIHWASDGDALALLKRERCEDNHHRLPGYGVRYPTDSATLNMLLSAPGIERAIREERQSVQALDASYHFGLVISDNRFGCYIPGVRSVIITHQLHLPLSPAAVRLLGNTVNHRLLRRFDEVIVPDYATEPRLAGPMSAPLSGVPVRYVGPVSRFSQGVTETAAMHGQLQPSEARVTTSSVLCLLSGPEPTRTSFESTLLNSLPAALDEAVGSGAYRITLVRGTSAPRSDKLRRAESLHGSAWTIEDLLTSEGVGRVLAKAELIVCRPGYTTVMDLAALSRTAVYVPTPGQPEQEWLGRSLDAQGRGVCVAQGTIGRPGVLAKALNRTVALSAAGVKLSPKPDTDLLDAWATGEISRLSQRTVNMV